MEDRLKIVIKPEDTLGIGMQEQEPLQLRLGNAVIPTGTTNYNVLGNKPKINGVTLQGNKSASELGLVNKSGDNMTGTLRAENYVTRWGLEFLNSNDTIVGGVYQDMWNNNNQFYINEFTSANKKECYLLPTPTASADSYFDILTSKNAVTIAQGGTGATTADDAVENLGAVKKAGDTMSGTLNGTHVRIYDSSYPMMTFISSASDTTALGAIFEDLSLRRIALRQRSSSGYTEDYFLPSNTATANKQYEIATSKQLNGDLTTVWTDAVAKALMDIVVLFQPSDHQDYMLMLNVPIGLLTTSYRWFFGSQVLWSNDGNTTYYFQINATKSAIRYQSLYKDGVDITNGATIRYVYR